MFNYWLEEKKEKALIWISWHMPKSIVYWCAIRLMSYATVGKYETQNVPELTAMDALKRWRCSGA